MKGNQPENMDDMLDIGSALKKEKTFKENQEKIAKLKAEHGNGEKEERSDASIPDEKHTLSKFADQKSNIKQISIFLCLIILITAGVRMYVASMPVTDQWAELVVSEGLKNQVTNIIYEQYPTLSESKKQELILTGTKEALSAEQNKDAIETLSEAYKESYRDPEGVSYLYEIDPYYFYEIAQDENADLNIPAHNLLAFLERWTYSLVKFFLPDINFVGSIFYLPIVFTILCGILIFFLTRELWNDLAGFIAALFFVLHPIILEFSIPGFVDTNMLNIFFILATGYAFIKVVDFIEKKEKKYYCYAGALLLVLAGLIMLFRYNWSTWYVSVLLIVVTVISVLGLQGSKILQNWKGETKTRKYVVGVILFLLIISGVFIFVVQKGAAVTALYEKIPVSIKKYLHLDYVDPYGQWPDAFALIKELQTAGISDFVGYLGGNLFLFVSLPLLIFFIYLCIKNPKLKYAYTIVAYVVFSILSFRAIRILPYFIPFFAITVGIGISVLLRYLLEKARMLVKNEKKILQQLSFIIVIAAVALPFVYPLVIQDLEKTQLMPIMDDALYNSAVFIKEQSNETAKVSTWWDRGTFYKVLAEREVHMQSQPHMPTTYWLATFYNTENEIQAKNIISMISCNHTEGSIPSFFAENFTNGERISIIKNILLYEGDEREVYLNETIGDSLTSAVMRSMSCEQEETYVVVIDDLMPRYSAVQYFAAWDFATEQPDPRYPYTDLIEGGCSRSQSGVYCSIETAQFFLNFTSLEVLANIAQPKEVYLVSNNTVQYKFSNQTASEMTLIVYQRAGYWKMLYVPKIVADSMYVKLMLLDGYNLEYFEKVFDEVHAETSWVKVYKMNWDSEDEDGRE